MILKKIKEVIATRKLYSADRSKRVIVKIGKPEKFPDSSDYYCPYQIIGLGNEKARYAAGVDAVQALQLALKMIGADLYTSKEARIGSLVWEGGCKGELGFPVPDSISDLAP